MKGGRSSGYLYPLRHPVFLRVEERTEGTTDGGETPAPPPASESKRGGRKTLVIVIAIVIVAAALGGIVFYLSQRGPGPAAATLDHVTVSAAQGSIDQVGRTTITARATYANNSLAVNYAGTVTFSSDDPAATLPPQTTFTPGTGIYVFQNVVIRKTGAVHITIVDTVASTLTGSAALTGNQAPTAAFMITPNAADPRQIAVNGGASSDPDGDPLTYAWTFGDGGTGSGVTTAHTYANTFEQTYPVRLTVTDPHGAANSAAQKHVALVPPTADYSVKQMNSSGSQIYVRVNAGGSASNNAGGGLVSYGLSWGDGSASSVAVYLTYPIYAARYNNAH